MSAKLGGMAFGKTIAAENPRSGFMVRSAKSGGSHARSCRHQFFHETLVHAAGHLKGSVMARPQLIRLPGEKTGTDDGHFSSHCSWNSGTPQCFASTSRNSGRSGEFHGFLAFAPAKYGCTISPWIGPAATMGHLQSPDRKTRRFQPRQHGHLCAAFRSETWPSVSARR